MINGLNGISSFMGNMGMGSMRPDPTERFNNADANGDGGLDKGEMQVVVGRISERSGQDISVDDIFSEFDADEDGVLSEQEAEAAMTQLKEEMGPEMMSRMGNMGSGPRGMAAYGDRGAHETESQLASMLNSLSEEEESLLDALNDDSDDEDELTIADILKTALESGAYSPLDLLV